MQKLVIVKLDFLVELRNVLDVKVEREVPGSRYV